MNERISKLAAQAWKEVYDETAIDGDDNPAPSIDEVVMFERKFAELIIWECVNVAKEADIKQPMVYSSDEILEHFGVEE